MEIEKMNQNVAIHQTLGTEPNTENGLSADQVKAKFDEGATLLKNYINETVVPAINTIDNAAAAAANAAQVAQKAAQAAQTEAEKALPLAGGKMTGDINMGGKNVTGSASVESGLFRFRNDLGSIGLTSGGTPGKPDLRIINPNGILGSFLLRNIAIPEKDTDAANKFYVDQEAAESLPLSGGRMQGDLYMDENYFWLKDIQIYAEKHGDGYRLVLFNPTINSLSELQVATPTDDESAANKQYVDDQVGQRVKTVNGQGPDATGNVDVESGGVKTVSSRAPDETGNVALTAADVGAIPQTGGGVQGILVFAGNPLIANPGIGVKGLPAPANGGDAVNKLYLEQISANLLSLSGGTMKGNLRMGPHSIILCPSGGAYIIGDNDERLILGANGEDALRIEDGLIFSPYGAIFRGLVAPQNADDAANKQYVDQGILEAFRNIDTAMFGDGDSGFNLYSEGQGPASAEQMAKPRASFYGNHGDEPVELWNVADPTTPVSAANKQYVDQKMEQIDRITVEEEGVAVIERTQEPNGTPYRFSRLYITAYLPKPQASYQPRFWCMYNKQVLSETGSTPGNIGITSDMFTTQICGVEHGIWMTYGIAPQQRQTWSGAINTQIGYNPIMASDFPECNRVQIVKSDGTAWEIGTTIKIYGVRAV